VAQVSAWHTSAADAARAKLPEGRRSAEILRHGSLEVRWYAPKGTDPQEPHDRDEIYIVASGQGMFVRGGERVAFRANDLLFVPAGMVHRFEEFSSDFATWVAFWGPQGGERESPF
jgi:mannose-6-phosphate isomerase-like protein (cupin superfamily)